MNKGYVSLISVLIIGVVASVVATTVILLGVANSRNSLLILQRVQARALADSCAEVALEKVRESVGFSGPGTLTLSTGSCNFSVSIGVGQNRSITANGYVANVVRKVSISVTQLNPQIVVSTWQEVN